MERIEAAGLPAAHTAEGECIAAVEQHTGKVADYIAVPEAEQGEHIAAGKGKYTGRRMEYYESALSGLQVWCRIWSRLLPLHWSGHRMQGKNQRQLQVYHNSHRTWR